MKHVTLMATILGLILIGCEDKKSDDNNHNHSSIGGVAIKIVKPSNV